MSTTASMTVPAAPAAATPVLDRLAQAALLAFVASVQISIAAAGILLTLTFLCWIAVLVRDRVRPSTPSAFALLAVYAVATLVSAAFSISPEASIADSKQLVLFALVPAVFTLARGRRAATVVDVVIAVGAASAAYGVIQYAMFHYDNLGQRPQGALTHYMTYSGVLMLVVCAALARVVFGTRDRAWPALVMPALVAALSLTLGRSAWVGTSAAVALLLGLKDFRLTAFLPLAVAAVLALAPDTVTSRMMSMFDLQDPSNRDRVAMIKTGVNMVAADPLTGVGPNMVPRAYRDLPRRQRRRGGQPPPAQRADADRGGAGPARARDLARVHRDPRAGTLPAVPKRGRSRPRAARNRPRRHRRDAGSGALRIQLRRFGVPDVVSGSRDLAFRCVTSRETVAASGFRLRAPGV